MLVGNQGKRSLLDFLCLAVDVTDFELTAATRSHRYPLHQLPAMQKGGWLLIRQGTSCTQSACFTGVCASFSALLLLGRAPQAVRLWLACAQQTQQGLAVKMLSEINGIIKQLWRVHTLMRCSVASGQSLTGHPASSTQWQQHQPLDAASATAFNNTGTAR